MTKMMTRSDIRRELGWSDEMLRTLLPEPDSPYARRHKTTGAYEYGLFKRAPMLTLNQTPEVLAAKWHWDRTVFGCFPAPSWTMRLGDIGQELGVNANSVGKILALMGLRCQRQVTHRAVTAECGVRRWDGYRTHHDWHLARVVAAIQSAAACPSEPAVAEALEAAVIKLQASQRLLTRRRKRGEIEAIQRREEEIVMEHLQSDLLALRATDSALSLLTAVEFITADPGQRVALYRFCMFDRNAAPDNYCPDRSSATRDLAFLGRRAAAEGFGGESPSRRSRLQR